MLFLAESFLHRFDPFAIEFPASWPVAGIRWYGLSYAVGFLIAWVMVRWIARRGWSPIPSKAVGDLMFAVILGVLVGGRLGYAIFYERHLLAEFSSSPPFWGLLAINKGGMASHGGMMGVIVACMWFARKHRLPVLHLCDVAALGCTPGLFLGRIANFINAELWGKPLPDSEQSNPPWWSVKYPQEILAWNPGNPLDAEKLAHLTPLHPIVGNTEKFLPNVVEAVQAGDQTVTQTITPLLTAYYPSQLFQAITDGPALFAFLVLIWLKPRKPGVVGAWFLIAYGALRIVTEVFRQPDQGVPLTFGLSRGQLLSVLMVLVGIAGLIVVSRRKVPKLGGVLAGASAASAA